MPTPQYLNEEAKLARELVDHCHRRYTELSDDTKRYINGIDNGQAWHRTLWKKQYMMEELIQARLRIKELEAKNKTFEERVYEKPMDKLFSFHWRDGMITKALGIDASDALTKQGYGAGAMKALDYWEEIPEEED
jgi:hypothetical protein